MSTEECGEAHEGKGEEYLTNTDRFERSKKESTENTRKTGCNPQFSKDTQTL